MTDLILFNANVITMNPAFPKAQLVAIQNAKISAVAGNDHLEELCQRKTKVIDCKGKMVLPGFIDAHCHFHALAESLVTLNLGPQQDIRSISDIQIKIGQLSQKLPPGTWLRARGYDEFYLIEKRHLTRWDLDKVTPVHPVKLTHRTGRVHVLNSLALKLVGISDETPDPSDGLINRDIETGEPTGLLYNMGGYLADVVPPIDNEIIERGIKLANRELLASGITSIQDVSSHNNVEQWIMFQRWKEEEFLKVRVSMMLGIEGFRKYHKETFSIQVGESQLRLGGVKIMVHETTGQINPSQEELTEMILGIHKSGLQVVFHAIEEKTIEAACSAIEDVIEKFPKPGHRHRIEHCSVCPPSLAKRLASFGIMVVTQPSFIYYNGERYLRTVPNKQLNHLYPIATLLNNGVEVAGSSDCPIVPVNPLIGIYSAISRKAETGEPVLLKEKISPYKALRMYTDYAAKTTFEETIKGSITPGKLADLVVLNGDPTQIPTEEIKGIEVKMTILNGEVVWDKMG